MIDRILIANRGEIACRIIRTLDRLNIQSIYPKSHDKLLLARLCFYRDV
jgi:acetyl/propionyl-CoA carboxylase alpha subunit